MGLAGFRVLASSGCWPLPVAGLFRVLAVFCFLLPRSNLWLFTRGVAPLSTGRSVVAGCATLPAAPPAGFAAVLADLLEDATALLAESYPRQ